MDKILQQLLEGQNKIVNSQTEIISRLGKIEGTVNKIEAGQQKDVIAMLERTATKNDMATLSASIDVLNARTFQQETKLRLIETSR